MKISKLLTWMICLGLILVTILFGARLTGRSYYITSTLILIEIMIPFFLAFEGRKPQARELVVVAVLCALGVAGRVVIPIPNFKVTYAIIILSAIAMGPETGFLVGAVSALVSNFFLGQGPHTPWQMMAYGAAGLIAGFAYRKNLLKRKPWQMAIFGAAMIIILIGPMLDFSTVFLLLPEFSFAAAGLIFLSGIPVNVSQAVCTFLMLRFLGEPFLEKLDRVKIRYGMMEEEDGI